MTSDTDIYLSWCDQLGCGFHEKWHRLLLIVIRSARLRLPWQVTQSFTDCDLISWIAASMKSDTDFYGLRFDQLGCGFHVKWHKLLLIVVRVYLLWFDQLGCGFYEKWQRLLLIVIRSARLQLPWKVTQTFTYCDSISFAASMKSDTDFYLLWFDQLGSG